MFPEIATERLRLSRVLPEDQQFLFEGLSDPVSMPYNGVYYSTFESTKAQLDWYDKNFNEGTGINWKISDRHTGDKIGVVSFYYYKPEHKKAELGFWVLPAFWRKGIASEALKAVTDYCQHVKGIHRLEAFVEDENTASRALLEKAGFQYEGTMRDCEIKFGRYISLRIYSLLGNIQP